MPEEKAQPELLRSAGPIARALYGSDLVSARSRVYYLQDQLPVFRMGITLCAYREDIDAFMAAKAQAARERAAKHPDPQRRVVIVWAIGDERPEQRSAAERGTGGTGKCQSGGASDGREIKPHGYDPQADFASTPAFDCEAIWAHIQMLFALAQGAHGKFVVLILTGDKADPPYEKGHFFADGGEREMVRMFRWITTFNPALGLHPDGVVRKPWKMPNGKTKTYPPDYRKKPLNIYVPFALFHPVSRKMAQGLRGRCHCVPRRRGRSRLRQRRQCRLAG